MLVLASFDPAQGNQNTDYLQHTSQISPELSWTYVFLPANQPTNQPTNHQGIYAPI